MADGEIEVPTHFLCPISLQLMRDPVTVSTGITFDRSTIERWLELSAGAGTACPVTKQPLSSDLIPNHTLRRLIQSWCTLNADSGIERIPTPKPPVDRSAVSKLISGASRSPNHLSKSIQRLKSIALRGADRDRSALRSSGAVPFLTSLLLTDNLTLASDGLETLAQIDASEDELRSVMAASSADQLITRLTDFLSDGDSQSRVYAIKLLKSLYSLADPNKLVTIKPHLLQQTIRLIRDQICSNSSKSALKLLIELNPWGRNKIKTVESGAIDVLIEILLDKPSKRICELVMVVLDQLCGCAEGRAGLLAHGAGLAVVSKKILRVSHTVSDRGVRILGSVSRFSANGVVLGEMAEVGVVAKLCLVLQVDCSLKTKERAKEVLKANSRVWKSSICVPSHLLRSYPTS